MTEEKKQADNGSVGTSETMTEETAATGAPAEEALAPEEPGVPEAEDAVTEDVTAEPETEKTTEKTAEKEKSEGKYKKENKVLTTRVKALEAQLIEVQNKFLAIYAEYENFRKRTVKEKEAILTDATADCLTAILPVIDNLERALSFPEGDKVVEGVRMTLNIFADVLKRLGVEEIETKTFDPALHNAVAHLDDENYGESEIVDVFQKGYKKGDKVLRAAMVRVAN